MEVVFRKHPRHQCLARDALSKRAHDGQGSRVGRIHDPVFPYACDLADQSVARLVDKLRLKDARIDGSGPSAPFLECVYLVGLQVPSILASEPQTSPLPPPPPVTPAPPGQALSENFWLSKHQSQTSGVVLERN